MKKNSTFDKKKILLIILNKKPYFFLNSDRHEVLRPSSKISGSEVDFGRKSGFVIEQWEIIPIQEDWIRLKNTKTALVLQVSNSGKDLTIERNLKPCNGHKPCLR